MPKLSELSVGICRCSIWASSTNNAHTFSTTIIVHNAFPSRHRHQWLPPRTSITQSHNDKQYFSVPHRFLLYLTLPLVFPPESGGPPESHCSPGTVQDSGYSPGGIWWDCFPTLVPFDSSGNPVGITLFRHHVPYFRGHVTSHLTFL